ncbi:MAG: hypothetical protein PHF86_12550, partial [Candidatus Nanoarchaeia archaeon]|nr:hypothetical protein [Candidatus Nanoarchaeia archaeon]
DNFEDFEIDVPIYDEKSKDYASSKFNVESFRKMWIKLNDECRDIKDKYKVMEIVATELREENSDLKRASEVLHHANSIGKTAVSEAIDMTFSHSINFSDMAKKFASLTERNLLAEQERDVYREKCNKLLSIIESTGDVTAYQKALADLKTSVEFVKSNVITVNQNIPQDKKVNVLPQQQN